MPPSCFLFHLSVFNQAIYLWLNHSCSDKSVSYEGGNTGSFRCVTSMTSNCPQQCFLRETFARKVFLHWKSNESLWRVFSVENVFSLFSRWASSLMDRWFIQSHTEKVLHIEALYKYRPFTMYFFESTSPFCFQQRLSRWFCVTNKPWCSIIMDCT